MKIKEILKDEKIQKIIKCFSGFCIMFCFFFLYYQKFHVNLIVKGIGENSEYSKCFFILGIITLVLLTIITYFINIKDLKKIHKLYFVVALVLGMCYLIIVPLFAQSDEPAHYLRAYEISSGYMATPYIEGEFKNEFDKSIIDSIYTNDKEIEQKKYEDMRTISKIKKNSSEKSFLNVSAANYSIINYIPHVIGILLGKIFSLNPYFCGLIGRFLSLFFCVSLVSIGIKLLPKGKFFAFILLLSPSFLSYSASFSADGTTIAYSFLLISYLLNKIEKKTILNKKDYLILMILTICTSLAKIVYFPIVFLFFLLPHECFKTKKQEIIIKSIFISIGIMANIGWQAILKEIATTEIASESVSGNVNTWIFKSPIRYLVVILNTILETGYNQLENIFAGEFLCHWQVRPYAIINFGFIISNLLAFFSEEKNKENNFIKTIFVLVVMAMIYILISTAMYLSCSIEGAMTINGIQGRYFFPIVCICLFFQVKNSIKINKDYVFSGIVILNYLVILSMLNVFVY